MHICIHFQSWSTTILDTILYSWRWSEADDKRSLEGYLKVALGLGQVQGRSQRIGGRRGWMSKQYPLHFWILRPHYWWPSTTFNLCWWPATFNKSRDSQDGEINITTTFNTSRDIQHTGGSTICWRYWWALSMSGLWEPSSSPIDVRIKVSKTEDAILTNTFFATPLGLHGTSASLTKIRIVMSKSIWWIESPGT